MTRAEYETFRNAIGRLDCHAVIEPEQPRRVEERNTQAKPRVLDAVLLDEVWETLEAIAFTTKDGES